MPRSAKPADGAIQPLAVLPLFHDLNGRRVLVAGETDAARWKADLLAAAGAQVVRAAGVSACADLAGYALAVADAADDGEAARFAAAARAAGVPVNVIDRPAFCDFSFGAIVNRSPVVVGISTAGAAPVFAQAIRRRIETLLPPGLARWAAAALSLRDRVAATLSDAARRRAFWREVAENAFRDPDRADPEAAIAAAPLAAAGTIGGSVTLVGAGPGGADQLTLQAVRTLQGADVILFDGRVSEEVLDLARREAKRLMVAGSRADTAALLVRLARQGKRVVVLRPGNPKGFARAEAAALAAAAIPTDRVAGVAADRPRRPATAEAARDVPASRRKHS